MANEKKKNALQQARDLFYGVGNAFYNYNPLRIAGEAAAKPVVASLKAGDVGATKLSQLPPGTLGQALGTFYTRQKQSTGAGLSSFGQGLSEFGTSSLN